MTKNFEQVEVEEKVKMLDTEPDGYQEQDGNLQEVMKRYQFLYNFSPVALSEADCTKMKEYLDDLREAGVVDFRKYFIDHPESIVDCMNRLTVLSVNEAMVALLKADSKERLKRGFGEVFHQESFESFREGIIAYAEGKSVFEAEAMLKTLKGKRRFVVLKWSFPPGFEESRTRMLGALLDITGAYRAEKQLRMFQIISDRANVGIAVTDLNGNLIYGNTAFARMHGYGVSEILGKHFTLFHTEEQLKELDHVVKSLRKKQSLDNVEVWHVRKDGSIFPTLSNATLIRDAKSGQVYVSTTAIDISDRKQMEKELDRRNRNLEEANIALRVVIENSRKEQTNLEEMLRATFDRVIRSTVRRLRKSGLNHEQQSQLDALETGLGKLIAPLASRELPAYYMKLTPAEMHIAGHIKKGLTSEEIARMLHVSTRTVTVHRNNIRRKLGLSNKKVNLQTYLASFEVPVD